ncbi:hypothetical protein SeMB42_g04529 [Synchytrium endobioticum]|uniref:SANT domain-containing protein n=1 Tax=Synchytrium endobioticum TaxID=286115 RepID=A0A507CXI1_9FUNG|nr:hypothetical protein SeMB42_g04529 [Synchytrium endobioticum]TPX46122.1 hypothetical protein SeLEV6574_g03413 [Synchytrium endobioticum]
MTERNILPADRKPEPYSDSINTDDYTLSHDPFRLVFSNPATHHNMHSTASSSIQPPTATYLDQFQPNRIPAPLSIDYDGDESDDLASRSLMHHPPPLHHRPSLLGNSLSPIGSPLLKRPYDSVIAYDDADRLHHHHQRPRLSISRPSSQHPSPTGSPKIANLSSTIKLQSPNGLVPLPTDIPLASSSSTEVTQQQIATALGLVLERSPAPDEDAPTEDEGRPSVEVDSNTELAATDDEYVDKSDDDYEYRGRSRSPLTGARRGSRFQARGPSSRATAIPITAGYSNAAAYNPNYRGFAGRRRGALNARASRFENYDPATMAARVPLMLPPEQRSEPTALEQRHTAVSIDDPYMTYLKNESAEAVLKKWTEEEIEQLDAGLHLLGPKGGAKAGHYYGGVRVQYKSQDWLGAAAKAVPTKSTRDVVQFYYMFRNKLPWWRARAADKYRRKMAVEDREYEKATNSAREWAERCEDEIERLARVESGGGIRRSERANAGQKRKKKGFVEEDYFIDDDALIQKQVML